jgi:hypothetical protein
MGVGMALFLATVILVWLEAEAIWVEATAPVRTRATTTARTMVFIFDTPESCIYILKISLDKPDETTIR